MEKVTIASAKDSGREFNNKKLFSVTLSDGRSGSSYDADILNNIGKEIELDVKAGKEYQGTMQYYFNLPKAKGAFPKKDYTVDKRIAALNAASRFKDLKSEDVIKLADKYLNWLNG